MVALFMVSFTASGQTYTVETVPNMKVKANQLVTNPDGILSATMQQRLNELLDSLEKETSAQVAVVMLHSIGDESEFDFAQNLFRSWGIGQAKNDNGLLILFVEDKRIIRFHTGFGLEGILPDVICKRIQMDKMVPRFKEGDVDGGMLAGILEVRKIIADPIYAEEVRTEAIPAPVVWDDEAWIGVAGLLFIPWIIITVITFFVKRKHGFANSVNGPGENKMHSLLTKGQWVLFYIVLPPIVFFASASLKDGLLFLAGIYGYFALLVIGKYGNLQSQTKRFLEKEEYHKLHEFYSQNKGFWITMTVFFPLPLLFVIGHYFKRKNSFRIHPRKCQTCGKTMTRLDDRAEDEYLEKSMLLEEEIKSVDYDVWRCNSCQALSIEVYYNEKTPYTPCPKCKTIAFYESSRRTISEATTSSSGSMEIVKVCKYCQHKKTEREIIPMIVVTSSSNSSSSSSYSGGSFGGGNSGGGGASSSW
jgi:uncharacterized protein